MDTLLLHRIIHMLLSLNIYQTKFEKPFLQATSLYYHASMESVINNINLGHVDHQINLSTYQNGSTLRKLCCSSNGSSNVSSVYPNQLLFGMKMAGNENMSNSQMLSLQDTNNSGSISNHDDTLRSLLQYIH